VKLYIRSDEPNSTADVTELGPENVDLPLTDTKLVQAMDPRIEVELENIADFPILIFE